MFSDSEGEAERVGSGSGCWIERLGRESLVCVRGVMVVGDGGVTSGP
jgi:hypothetical protein